MACLLNKNCINKTGGKGTFKSAEQSELFPEMSESGKSCTGYTVYARQSEKKKGVGRSLQEKYYFIYVFTIRSFIHSFIELVNHSSSHHYILRI